MLTDALNGKGVCETRLHVEICGAGVFSQVLSSLQPSNFPHYLDPLLSFIWVFFFFLFFFNHERAVEQE